MNPVMVVRNQFRILAGGEREPLGRGCWVWCPGCQDAHKINVVSEDGSKDPITWDWDGNLERPTFSPSILCGHSVHLCPPEYTHTEVCQDPDNCGARGHGLAEDGSRTHYLPHAVTPAFGRCHSYIRAGRWEFLDDCAHSLAGKTVDMVSLPDWLVTQ